MAHDGLPHDHDHAHDHDHSHGHGHDHGRGHDHSSDDGHDHSHAHGHDHDAHGPHAAPSNELGRGAGQGKILYLDAPSGLAGDMIIAALVDLGVPRHVILDATAALGLPGVHVHFGRRERSSIFGTSFDVHVEKVQPARSYAQIVVLIDEAKLDADTKRLAHAAFRRLAEAEAKVHHTDIAHVHFHEVGAVDSIVDMVGAAAALAYLGARLLVSPLPMGRGFTKSQHGTIPLPAPAVVECLRGLATIDGVLPFEFVTPTGAALVGALAEASSAWPAMAPEAVGWGAGTAKLSDRPNLLRAVLGSPPACVDQAHVHSAPNTHTVIECNLDDATGELVASCIESLLLTGALDAWATPIVMKKGRPATTLSVLCEATAAGRLSAQLLAESTSIGVRHYGVARAERPRRITAVTTPYGEVPLKIAEGPYGPAQVKPEFDACLVLAKTHGVPVREVLRSAIAAYEKR